MSVWLYVLSKDTPGSLGPPKLPGCIAPLLGLSPLCIMRVVYTSFLP